MLLFYHTTMTKRHLNYELTLNVLNNMLKSKIREKKDLQALICGGSPSAIPWMGKGTSSVYLHI